tara:strand:+ start:349 stop:1380 length:1032 start_codon:yes stop_codon:yes gene_type:complete
MSQKIIYSNNFAKNSDLIYSQSVSAKEFENIKDSNKKIISETHNSLFSSITYSLKKFSLNENDVIYCHSDLLEELFLKLNKCKFENIKLISNQSDRLINNKIYKKKPSCISEWYGVNIEASKKDLIPIPLGLSNPFSKKNLTHKDFDINNTNFNSDERENKVYLNFRESTNYQERRKIYKQFENKEWAFISEPNLNNSDYKKDLSSYRYVLCPWGNGVDTHRVFESLYSGAVPILKIHKTYSNLEDLPILFVKSYNEINEKLLQSYSKKLQKDLTNKEKLNIDWWINTIKRSRVPEVGEQYFASENKLRSLLIVLRLKSYYYLKSKYKKIYFIYIRILNKLSK